MNWFERGWYKQHKFIFLLLPLSALFWLLSGVRRLLYKLAIKKSVKIPVPVIVVGNITVGGTGKTPFVIWLVKLLMSLGLKPGVISRGYGSQIKTGHHLVTEQDHASKVGDEAKLIFNQTAVPVMVGRDRVVSAKLLIENEKCNFLICDDGLQHYKLQRDLEIILIDGTRQLGNGCLLPAGPLREGKWRLKTTDFVIQNGQQNSRLSSYSFSTKTLPPRLVKLASKPAKHIAATSMLNQHSDSQFDYSSDYIAVCAIGNPQRFSLTLKNNRINILEHHNFIDHHSFTLADFNQWNEHAIIMTEKDAVKCTQFAKDNWWYLPIEIKPDNQFTDRLTHKLIELRKQYGF